MLTAIMIPLARHDEGRRRTRVDQFAEADISSRKLLDDTTTVPQGYFLSRRTQTLVFDEPAHLA